jgi:hypothetical protein
LIPHTYKGISNHCLARILPGRFCIPFAIRFFCELKVQVISEILQSELNLH